MLLHNVVHPAPLALKVQDFKKIKVVLFFSFFQSCIPPSHSVLHCAVVLVTDLSVHSPGVWRPDAGRTMVLQNCALSGGENDTHPNMHPTFNSILGWLSDSHSWAHKRLYIMSRSRAMKSGVSASGVHADVMAKRQLPFLST